MSGPRRRAPRSSGRRPSALRRRPRPTLVRRAALLACGSLWAASAPLAQAVGPVAAARLGGVGIARLPLPTAVETAAGTWASVPMGHLDQPLNTFWQLFFLPQGGSLWSDHAQDLGVATNGGIVLAASGPSSLLASVGPSHLLSYSTLLWTSGTGRSWTPGAPIPGPVEGLAADPASGELALVARGGGEVLSSTWRPGTAPASPSAPLPGWRLLLTRAALAASGAGRSCEPTALTAVAYGARGEPVVGASCLRPGALGVFVEAHGAWRLAAPRLPGEESRSPLTVLRLGSGGSVPTGLAAIESPSGPDLVALGPGGLRPGLSEPLPLGRGALILSVGSDDALGPGGELALYENSSGALRLAVTAGAGRSWTELAPPPAGTATVAFGPTGIADALAVDGTVMTDWRLAPGTQSWARHQVARVDILFGSSG